MYFKKISVKNLNSCDIITESTNFFNYRGEYSSVTTETGKKLNCDMTLTD